MPKHSINITGTAGATYDLDKLAKESRLNGDERLVVQVYKYKQGENPNPPDLQIGQIWISKLDDSNQ